MRYQIIISIAALFAGVAASAQNFNPVVEVTNTYAQEATGIEKPDQPIAVPDSLLRFNLDMDYEMRTAPYRGAYEFNPYLVELKPMPRQAEEGTLFLRLGAGYGFHPELDAVWTPVKTEKFRLNLFANHRGYYGDYHNIGLTDDNCLRGDGTLYGGADATTAAGVNTLLGWQTGTFTAGLQYQNVLSSDPWTEVFNHLVVFDTRVQSAPQTKLYYNLGAQVRYLTRTGLNGTFVSGDGGLGVNLSQSQFRVDFNAESAFTSMGNAGQAAFTPRYVFRMGAFRLNLGLKLAFTFRSDENFFPYEGGHVFPDVHVDYQVVPEDFILQAYATGGNVMQNYGRLLSRNHFMPSFMNHPLDVETERINVGAGARGNISERLHYDARIGYAYRTNGLLWGYETAYNLLPTVGFADYGMFYADLEAGWKSERLDADMHLRYQSTNVQAEHMFSPAAFTAQAKLLYNWGGRIKAGADLDAVTERSTPEGIRVPGYADLGLYGEYGFTRKFALWLRVGNLLNQEVQRTLFHAERGIWFSVGAQYHF